MANAADVRGVVFRNGSAVLLARVTGENAACVQQADISSAEYTVFLLDVTDPSSRVPVEGHTDEVVPVAGLIYDTAQNDDLWDVDVVGYNFKHVLDVSANAAFPLADRNYLIEFRLTPAVGQVILVRFEIRTL